MAKLEEQYYTGIDDEALIEYGISADDNKARLAAIKQAVQHYGLRKLAKAAGISYQQLSAIKNERAMCRQKTMLKIERGIRKL